MHPLKCNHASPVKNKMHSTQNPSYEEIMLSITELPRNWWPTKLKQDSEPVLNDSAMLEVSIAAGVQLPISLLQYLYVSDLWVASYTVHPAYLPLITTGFSFIDAPNTAVLSHRIPASAGIYRDSCGVQDSHKRKAANMTPAIFNQFCIPN